MATADDARRRAASPSGDVAALRVLLVDDHRILREALTRLLDAQPGLHVEGTSSRALATRIAQLTPQVILLDGGLRDGDSVAIARQLRARWPAVRVVVMDLLPAASEREAFLSAGVAGFTGKEATVAELVDVIRRVADGEPVEPVRATASVLDEIARLALARGAATARRAVRMTPRERQVVALIAEGCTNREIGERLHIATHTVKSHVRNVMEKLALHTRLQIAAYAYRDSREE